LASQLRLAWSSAFAADGGYTGVEGKSDETLYHLPHADRRQRSMRSSRGEYEATGAKLEGDA
jgi:hypothetical protein